MKFNIYIFLFLACLFIIYKFILSKQSPVQMNHTIMKQNTTVDYPLVTNISKKLSDLQIESPRY